jgi:hypothetical protein
MGIIVDVENRDYFDDTDLSTYGRLVVKEAYPELYGEDLPKAIKCIGDFIVNIDDLQKSKFGHHQQSRRSGKNKKYDQIKQSIWNNGFKLRYPAIAIFRDKLSKLWIITGHTRREILEKYGFTKVIVTIYEASEGYSDDDVKNALSSSGVTFNTIHDEAAPTPIEDIHGEVEHAIDQGWIKKTIEDITKRVDLNCGRGVLSDNKRSFLVNSIFNQYNPEQKIISWKNSSDRDIFFKKKKIKLVDQNLIPENPLSKIILKNDSNGIRTVCYTTRTADKTLSRILKTAVKFPNDIIRVILHTGTLEGICATDLEKCYEKRVEGFIDFFNDQIDDFSKVFFDGKEAKSNIKLYAVLPALATIHNLDELVFFDKNLKLIKHIKN